MVNLTDEGENEKPIKIGVNFLEDMKPELIALLKEFREIRLVLPRYARVEY